MGSPNDAALKMGALVSVEYHVGSLLSEIPETVIGNRIIYCRYATRS